MQVGYYALVLRYSYLLFGDGDLDFERLEKKRQQCNFSRISLHNTQVTTFVHFKMVRTDVFAYSDTTLSAADSNYTQFEDFKQEAAVEKEHC